MTTEIAEPTRGLSIAELERRINLNAKSGWGLEKGTGPQLNLLALYCQKHGLLPGDDVTLYDGKPWITIDGRVKLMRRNKDYRGFTYDVVAQDKKVEMGYDPDDLVWTASVRVAGYPDPITGYGKVSKAERAGQGAGRLNPVAKVHPVEMAQKRAIARAERLAFGTESYVDDEDLEEAARVVIQEREDPERVAMNAARYDEIHAAEEQDEVPMVTVRSPLSQRLAELVEEAARLEVPFDDCKVSYPTTAEEVIRKGQRLRDRIDDKKRQLAGAGDEQQVSLV